ncbi:MAG: Crp/Fnr family transcriptional regulator [Prevotellaceae bacterium]|nr:Crp/Fnr family transcriptional regulator [Prevotellaceae bacterium]
MGKELDTVHYLRYSMSNLFSCLSEEEQERLEKVITIENYKKHQVIYQEGDQPSELFCLLEGKVKVYKQGAGGRNQTMKLIKPVEYFGYRPFLTDQYCIMSAATLEESVIAQLHLPYLVSLIQSNSRVAWFFIQQLALELGKADERTVSLTQKHICGRLAEALISLKESYGLEEDGCTLSIYISREDLANLSNMTTSNAIRTLSAFSSDKLIATDGRKIKIINEKELLRISKLG